MGHTAKKGKAQKSNDGGEDEVKDRLSSLPDVIIADILSLLPTQSAVATSVLSRRWLRLWTHISSLDFDSIHFDRRRFNFFTVVGKILHKLDLPSIRRFKLHICLSHPTTVKISRKRCCSKLDLWIRQLCDRNVEEIEIWYEPFGWPLTQVVLPPCIFQTQSLVVLKLDELFDFKLPDDVEINLPNLKILGMALLYDSHYKLMPKLVESCSLLEQLYLVEGNNYYMKSPVSIDISAQSLKRLSMKRFGSSQITKVVIDTPKLESLYIGGHTWIRYCFVKNPIGLLEAEVNIHNYGKNADTTFNMEFFEAISSVKSLTGCRPELRAMTMFTSLTHFRMTMHFPKDFVDLMPLLEFFPTLEVLSLHLDTSYGGQTMSWYPPDSAPSCLLTHVKKLEMNIKNLEDNKDWMMALTKYMLITADVLERLIFVTNTTIDKSIHVQQHVEYEFGKELYECPRRSSLCQIEFHGMHLKVFGQRRKVRVPNGRMLSFT